jgi:hypothetical protein
MDALGIPVRPNAAVPKERWFAGPQKGLLQVGGGIRETRGPVNTRQTVSLVLTLRRMSMPFWFEKDVFRCKALQRSDGSTAHSVAIDPLCRSTFIS